MKKKTYFVSAISSVLLSPLFLSNQLVTAEAVDAASQPEPKSVTAVTSAEVLMEASKDAVTTDNLVGTSENETALREAAPIEAVSDDSATSTKDIVILHTNDMHGRLEEDKRGKVIGVAKLDALVNEERAKEDQVTLLFDAGDALQGLPISNNTKGEDMAGILNQIGYDAMAVGNHEFDFGFDQVVKYKEIFTFPLLSANTYVNGVRVFEPSTIIDKDKTITGDEVVAIGVTTPETYTKTHPRNIQNVEFRDPITEVKNVINEIESQARAEGKEYKTYVVFGHLGIDDTTKVEWRGSTMIEELSSFAPLTGKNIIMIDGHSHTAFSKSYAKNRVYNQTGNYLNAIGKITITPDGTATPTLVRYKDLEALKPSSTIAEKVAEIKEKFNQENAVIVIEHNPVDFNGDRSNVRVRETNIGNVVADAMYYYGQTGFKQRTDVAVTNGGGLRDSIKKDIPVTKGDIIAVLPFGNIISQIEVKGEQLLAMFQHSLSAVLQKDAVGTIVLDERGLPLLEPNGGFLHASGVRVYYDTTLEANDRILRIEVLDQKTGKYMPLELEKIYYLATNDFLAAGGDGYTMLGGAREEGPSMDTVFAEYLKQAELTNYATVNPNERIIALSTEAFHHIMAQEKVMTTSETKEIVTKESVPTGQFTPLATQGASELDKKMNDLSTKQTRVKSETKSDKQLPRTGTEKPSIAVGLVVVLFGMLSIKKRKDITDR